MARISGGEEERSDRCVGGARFPHHPTGEREQSSGEGAEPLLRRKSDQLRRRIEDDSGRLAESVRVDDAWFPHARILDEGLLGGKGDSRQTWWHRPDSGKITPSSKGDRMIRLCPVLAPRRRPSPVGLALALALILVILVIAGTSLSFPVAWGQASPMATSKAEPFPTGADPSAQIADALVVARRENQRVLIVWGGNWCGWSRELVRLLEKDRTLAREVLYEYRVVKVNLGRINQHLDLAARYGVDVSGGSAPYLTVLAPSGSPEGGPVIIERSDARALARDGSTDTTLVQMWLASYRATPLDAKQVLDAALSDANEKKKRVFIHFSAPW